MIGSNLVFDLGSHTESSGVTRPGQVEKSMCLLKKRKVFLCFKCNRDPVTVSVKSLEVFRLLEIKIKNLK